MYQVKYPCLDRIPISTLWCKSCIEVAGALPPTASFYLAVSSVNHFPSAQIPCWYNPLTHWAQLLFFLLFMASPLFRLVREPLYYY